jgi:hypothetical protein
MSGLSLRFPKESDAVYIVKPDGGAQGRGIWLTNNLSKLKAYSDDLRVKGEKAAVQKYLAKPMLLDGKKFDLRIYVLLCGRPRRGATDLDLKCFIFRDGLVRLCTSDYEAPTDKTFNDTCMHLTNYEVNRHSDEFQESTSRFDFSKGSKRSLSWFLVSIEEQYGAEERKRIWTELCSICVKTVIVAQPSLSIEYEATFCRDLTAGHMGCRCFEILGFDVMLSSNRKPYLIEVNHLPSLECGSPVDVDIKRRVISQALDLTCDELSSKDRYQEMAKQRLPPVGKRTTPLDSTEYEDFLRIFPPTASCPEDLVAEYKYIQSKMKGVYKPVSCNDRGKWPGVAERRATTPPPKSQTPGKGFEYPRPSAIRTERSSIRDRSMPASRADAEAAVYDCMALVEELSPLRSRQKKMS